MDARGQNRTARGGGRRGSWPKAAADERERAGRWGHQLYDLEQTNEILQGPRKNGRKSTSFEISKGMTVTGLLSMRLGSRQ